MYIIATSREQSPASFTSSFTDPINISEGYEIALISIYHGPLYNITNNNNYLIIENGMGQQTRYQVDPGYYESTYSILLAIKKKLSISGIASSISRVVNHYVLSLSAANEFYTTAENGGLMHYLGQYISNSKIKVEYDILGSTTEPTFIYSNVVSETVIDGQYSRILATVPLKTDIGYNHHEFSNPLYHKLRVNNFTDISFQLRDVNGELLQIADRNVNSQKNAHYPTVMLLNLRKRHE